MGWDGLLLAGFMLLCSYRNTTRVPWPLKHITWQDGLLQPCKQESVCPTSGRREVRTVTDSLQPWFSYWSVTDKTHQTVHNLSDGDDRIPWGVGTRPPFSIRTHEHTQLFSFLFGLSAPLSTICSMMVSYRSQRYKRLSSSSSSNGHVLRAERGYHIQ